jgi:hypothetical protein
MIAQHDHKERVVHRQNWECDWEEGIYGKQKLEYKMEGTIAQEKHKKT